MEESPKYKILALMSGGMDSTFAAYWAEWQTNYKIVAAMFVNYGQKGAGFEWAAAKKIMDILRIEHTIYLDASTLITHLSGSILEYGAVAVGDTRARDMHGNPATFVPGRNAILLSLALPYVYRMGLNAITGGWSYMDVEYPDCSPEFLGAFGTAGAAALGRDMHVGLRILAPAASLTKAEEIQWIQSRDVPLPWEQTRSCYSNHYKACGECDSCLVRARAFLANDMRDPAYGAITWESVKGTLAKKGYLDATVEIAPGATLSLSPDLQAAGWSVGYEEASDESS